LKGDIHLRNGLNVCDGKITCKSLLPPESFATRINTWHFLEAHTNVN
jgi:hypothetical protein